MAAEIRKPDIKTRYVWRYNVHTEFKLIQDCVDRYPFATMDTEFPGVIYRPHKHVNMSSSDLYAFLKANVDSLNLIQIGLTLSDSDGNLPDLGSDSTQYIWEFNFRDFDIYRDYCSADSIELLRTNGIDFDKNMIDGIDSGDFAALLMSSGLILNDSAVSWVTFHGAYDFGYLVKMLTQRNLPTDLEEFMELVKVYFGENFFDLKHMMKFCDGLFGGLDRIASALGVDRTVGKCHQAGSDSLLTCQTFLRMRDLFFKDGGLKHAGVLVGLEVF